jgi:hypothetical protein
MISDKDPGKHPNENSGKVTRPRKHCGDQVRLG